MKCKKNKQAFKLQEETIAFIKQYMLEELNITTPIDMETLQKIETKCFELDEEFASKEINSGYVMLDETKCRGAGNAEKDIFNAIESGQIDFDDLNKRLGL